MELQQSPPYKRYIERLGWQSATVDGIHIYIRSFPLFGALAKIQRPETLPGINRLAVTLRARRVRLVAVEPCQYQKPAAFSSWVSTLSKHFRISRSRYLPTKTLLVDLSPSLEDIFSQLSEAKRRAVRRAQKHMVTVRASGDIDLFIRLKNQSAGLFGSITTYGLKALWQEFAPRNAIILLSYSRTNRIVGGVLVIFWRARAYYWIAGATREGKKLFAPTLLAWEALRLSKRRGEACFDFVGVWDERLPKQNREWLGFTKFKEGFGGIPVYYPIAMPRK